MFEQIPKAPADPVFGLIDQYNLDSNPDKINLSVGAYKNEKGQTPILRCVKSAEQLLVECESTKNYLPIQGLQPYNELVAELIFGADHPVIKQKRFATAQTPGGTGALRVAGDLLRRTMNVDTVWICNPTWANHGPIYQAAQLNVQRYEYLNEAQTDLDFGRMIASLEGAQAGQAILLHTVCHNPSGFDLDPQQWDQLLNMIKDRKLIPIFDFAYQGFAQGLDDDAQPIRKFCERSDALICQSFSKNFGLYSERVGTVTAVGNTESTAEALLSQIKRVIRTMYSNPPRHGAAIVHTVLANAELRAEWESELGEVRDRINQLREGFVATLDELTPERDFSYISRQRGMFSYSGLTKPQVERLRNEFSIYIVGSGRINIAGVNSANNRQICEAIANVV
jgi:aspartate/tyrosine/aromatic aminotransferase